VRAGVDAGSFINTTSCVLPAAVSLPPEHHSTISYAAGLLKSRIGGWSCIAIGSAVPISPFIVCSVIQDKCTKQTHPQNYLRNPLTVSQRSTFSGVKRNICKKLTGEQRIEHHRKAANILAVLHVKRCRRIQALTHTQVTSLGGWVFLVDRAHRLRDLHR
jgi:hypothetical protein